MKEYRKIYNITNKHISEKYNQKYRKIYLKSNAKYELYKDKLTIDEDPRLSKDGISLEVKCRYCGKYFIPTNSQTSNRIGALNCNGGDKGLYCSEGV